MAKGRGWPAPPTHLARICERRGGILLFFIPLATVRLALQPFFPQEHNWADFFFQMSFFLLGFILFSQPGFLESIYRDWRINLIVGMIAAGSAMAIALSTGTLDLQVPPHTTLDILFWILISIDGWCWTLFFLFIGMRYLDFTDPYLEYGKKAILPFFIFHQPVIVILAYFVVQWQASLIIKLLFVVIGSFCLTLFIYHFIIRRVALFRMVFGMKIAPRSLNRVPKTEESFSAD